MNKEDPFSYGSTEFMAEFFRHGKKKSPPGQRTYPDTEWEKLEVKSTPIHGAVRGS